MIKTFSISLQYLVLVLLNVISLPIISAQEVNSVVDNVINTLNKVDNLYESSSTLKEVTVNVMPSNYNGVDEWKSARNSSKSKSSGLDLRMGYDRKFGDVSEDLYEDYYSYANKFFVMLSWNILDCGFIGKEAYEKRTELKGLQYKMAEDNYNTIAAINETSVMQGQLLDGYYNKVYKTKIELYNSLLSLQQDLRSKGQSTNMEGTEIEMRIALNSGLLRETPIKVEEFMDVEKYLSMQFIIEEYMIDSLLSKNYILAEKELETQIVESEDDNISYWNLATVSPYVRAQHYSGEDLFNRYRTTANIGVTATLPLFTGIKSKKSEVSARALLQRNTIKMLETSIKTDLEEEIRYINNNYKDLFIAIKLRDINIQKIKQAYLAYNRKQLSIQDLAALYMPLLESQLDIYDLITERERLKSRLEIINNRN